MQMLKTILFITIIMCCNEFAKGFTNMFSKGFIKGLTKLNRISKTKLNARITSTTFYEDDDGTDRRRKNYNYNYNYNYETGYDYSSHVDKFIPAYTEEEMDDYETLYTLIWFDCEDCRQLLCDVKNARKKILYIDGTYYFFDENDATNTPIFYKNDELVATDIFSIYEELFFN